MDKPIWNDKGFRVYSKYIFLKPPLKMKEHYAWFEANIKDESAFQINGKGKQRYLCNLDEAHTKYILNQLLLSQDK